MAWNGYSEKGQGSEERGPGTFTFAPPGVPQQQGSAPIMAKMGYQTAQSVGGISTYDTGQDKTSAAIFGFAETMLKPVAQELAARKFLEGVQRAASGEALTEIVNEQPWYSRIFGPSSAVEGARQYSLDAQAAKFDAAVQQAMPSLRGISPDELPGIIQQMGKEFQTGDAATDAQLGLRLTKMLPNLIQQHTREYYKAQQEHASNQRFNAAQLNATSLQAVASNEMAGPDDVMLREGNLLQTYLLPAGVDPKSHEKFVYNSLASIAEAGQFHALATLIKGGVMKYLQPEDRLKLERSIRTYKKQHAADARESYAQDFVKIHDRARNDPEYSAAQVMADYDALNGTYSKLSGNDEPLVTGTTRASTAQSALHAYWQRMRQAEQLAAREIADVEKAQGAAAAQELEDGKIRALFETNGFAGARESGVYKVKDVERVFLEDWNKTKEDGTYDWDARANMIRHHGAYKGDGTGETFPGAIRVELARLVNSSGNAVNNNFLGVYQLYRNLTANVHDETGKAAALAAFGTKQVAVLETFRRETAGKDLTDAAVLAQAYAVAKDPLYDPTAKFTDKEMPVVDSYLEKAVRGKTGEWGTGGTPSMAGQIKGTWWKFGRTPDAVTPSAQSLYKTALASRAKMLMNRGFTLDEALQAAGPEALEDVEMVGGYGWSRAGRETTMLDTIKRAYPDKYVDKPMLAAAMNSLVAETHKANSPGELADVSIYMGMDDADGMQNLIVSMRNEDGTVLNPVYINGHTLMAQVEKLAAAKIKERKPLTYGPELTYPPKPDPKQPSIYAPAAEWAKYREYQRDKREKE